MIFIDPSFTPKEQSAIYLAYAEWAVSSPHFEERLAGRTLLVRRVDSFADRDRRGEYDHSASTIRLLSSVQMGPCGFFTVVLHEFGHAAGLPHVADGVDSVMQVHCDKNIPTVPTAYDIEALK